MVELALFARCMYCGRKECKKAHGLGGNGTFDVGCPFLMLFVSQMMKSPEMQRAIVDNVDKWVYIGLMCFAIPVHELAFAVEAVSAAQLGATTEMNALDLADEIINAGMPTLNNIPGYTGSVQQLMRESKDVPRDAAHRPLLGSK